MKVTDVNFNPGQNPVIHAVKIAVNELAEYISAEIPPGRRRSIALTTLEDFGMWAVKAAACGDE